MTHYLARTVHVVGHQRQTDGSFLRDAVGSSLVLATHDGDIALLHLSGSKLLLQTMIGKLGLGNHHQSAGRHVEPMNDERSCGLGHSAPHDGIHRLSSVLSWNRQHSSGLAYYGYLLIFVDSLQFRPVFFRPRAGGLGQHPLQDGLALAVAGRIEAQMMANFLLRTLSPPKHGHLQRPITMAVSILQQLGLTAFTASSRWNLGSRVLENLQEILALALWVEHTELAKQPSLQRVGELLAQLFQKPDVFLVSVVFLFDVGLPVPFFLESSQLGLHKLAFPHHLRLFLLAQVARLASCVAQSLGSLHL